MLHQQTPRLRQLRRRKAPQELRGVNQVDRRLRTCEHQRFHRNIERVGDLPQQQNRDVALAGFELREVAFRNAGVARQHLAGHAAAGPRFAHALAQQLQVVGLGGRLLFRGFRVRAGRHVRLIVGLLHMHYVAFSGHGGCIILPGRHV